MAASSIGSGSGRHEFGRSKVWHWESSTERGVDADDDRPEKPFLSIHELELVCAASVEMLDVFQIMILPMPVAQMAVISVARLAIQPHRELFIWVPAEIGLDIQKFVYVAVLHIGLQSRMAPRV